MIHAYRQNGTILMVAFIKSSNKCFIHAKQMIAKGDLDRVFQCGLIGVFCLIQVAGEIRCLLREVSIRIMVATQSTHTYGSWEKLKRLVEKSIS